MPQRPIFQHHPKPWRTTSTKRVASLGKVELHLDRLIAKNGFRMNHPRLVLHDFSIIVPVANNNRLVFVWNYRPPIRGWELELPAGLVDDGESPQDCARRELAEETGYSARTWKKLGWLHTTPGDISSESSRVPGKRTEDGKSPSRALRANGNATSRREESLSDGTGGRTSP